MSIMVRVEGCKPSHMLKAAHALLPSIPETGWDMLDVLGGDLTQGRANPYWKYRDEYRKLEERLKELRRVYAAISKAKDKWLTYARASIEQEMAACDKNMKQFERMTTPTHLEAFLASQLGKEGATGVLIPGRGLEIRLPDGSVLELIAAFYEDKARATKFTKSYYQSLRYAPFTAAVSFLENLACGRCEVQREGSHERITSWWDSPSEAAAALKSREGRAIAHRKHPPFSKEGDVIPV